MVDSDNSEESTGNEDNMSVVNGVEPVAEPRQFTLDPALPDPLYDAYRKMLQHVVGLPEIPMKASVVRRTLEGFNEEETVWCLDQLLRGALWGHAGAAETMLAAIWYLIQMRRDDDYEMIKGLFQTAYDSQRRSVLDLLREVPPHQALADGQRLPEVRLPMDRDVSLGERRSMAAGPKRRILERLLMDPDPLVIRKLLDNPHIRVGDVQVIATRRPTTPDILLEVVRHRLWFRRYGAREAVTRNPYTDTGLALKLLPTLRVKTLRRLANSGDLHPLMSDSAARLVKLREERTAPWRV